MLFPCPLFLRDFWRFGSVNLGGNCSATRYSVAAPPPGARQGFGGPMHPRHPPAVAERGATGAFGGGGGSCNTPATHSELRNEPRQGCSYTVERDRGGVASAPLSPSMRKSLAIAIVRFRCTKLTGSQTSQSDPAEEGICTFHLAIFQPLLPDVLVG